METAPEVPLTPEEVMEGRLLHVDVTVPVEQAGDGVESQEISQDRPEGRLRIGIDQRRKVGVAVRVEVQGHRGDLDRLPGIEHDQGLEGVVVLVGLMDQVVWIALRVYRETALE